MLPERRAHRVYELIAAWGGVVLILAIWPVLFLVVFLGYLSFPLVTLLMVGLAFLTWRFLRTLPHTLRSSVNGERNRH